MPYFYLIRSSEDNEIYFSQAGRVSWSQQFLMKQLKKLSAFLGPSADLSALIAKTNKRKEGRLVPFM